MSKMIYNVTVKVEPEILEDWLQWMRTEHIPKVLKKGHFLGYRFCRILDPGSPNTYAVQYISPNSQVLQQYIDHEAPALRKEGTDRYGDKFAAFRTLLEILD